MEPESKFWGANNAPLVGVVFGCLKVFPGEAKGGLPKLKTDEPPGPVGVAGKGPGEASREVIK